jgi:predicted Zn-dependent peptidase
MARLMAVTPADVKRVANTYLTAARVRLDVVPGEPTPRAPEVEVDRTTQGEVAAPTLPPVRDTFDRGVMPTPGPTPDFTPPPVARRRLSNGLELLVVERRDLPILTLNLVVKGARTSRPRARRAWPGWPPT